MAQNVLAGLTAKMLKEYPGLSVNLVTGIPAPDLIADGLDAGTWMEDQDMFYDGGIFRDVYLYAAPLVHIQDYTVVTDLDENYQNASLKLSVDVANASSSAANGYKVDARQIGRAHV